MAGMVLRLKQRLGRACTGADLFTGAMLLVGAGLITVLPFGFGKAARLHLTICNLAGLRHECSMTSTECWEVAAVSWSIIYGIAMVLFELVRRSDKEAKLRASWASLLLGITVTIIMIWVSRSFLVSGIQTHNPTDKIIAELVTVGWFLYCDSWIAKSKIFGAAYKNEARIAIRHIDVPALIAFVVMWIYAAQFLRLDDPSSSGFASGASAMALILTNGAFAVLFLRRSDLVKAEAVSEPVNLPPPAKESHNSG